MEKSMTDLVQTLAILSSFVMMCALYIKMKEEGNKEKNWEDKIKKETRGVKEEIKATEMRIKNLKERLIEIAGKIQLNAERDERMKKELEKGIHQGKEELAKINKEMKGVREGEEECSCCELCGYKKEEEENSKK